MQIRIIDEFQAIPGENRSQVFELIPSQFGDERGKFCEVLKKQVFEKTNDTTDWVFGMEWIKQVNRSESIPGVVRGMHAQKGSNCQGKLVSCVSGVVYDIIVDARPNSKTYGKTKAFRLDSASYNMLWVPRGFLHGFGVPFNQEKAVFEYMCDNVYDKQSEFSICPSEIVRTLRNGYNDAPYKYSVQYADFVELLNSDVIFSEKDAVGANIEDWLRTALADYTSSNKIWYC